MRLPFIIEPLGMVFQRFRAKDSELHCAAWGDGANSHVYSVRVSRSAEAEGWEAALENDGREVGRVSCGNRTRCVTLALAAMRAYLLRGHRRTLRTMRMNAAEAYAECHPYEMDLLDACGSDLSLAHAVEAVALRRGFTPDRLRGTDFAAILDLAVAGAAMSNTPRLTEGGAE